VISAADDVVRRSDHRARLQEYLPGVAKASGSARRSSSTPPRSRQAAGARIEKIASCTRERLRHRRRPTACAPAPRPPMSTSSWDDAYPLGITDTTPLINKLRGSGAQAVFPVSYLNDSLLIIRTMRQQKLTIPAIGGAAGYVIPDFEKGSASSPRTCCRRHLELRPCA